MFYKMSQFFWGIGFIYLVVQSSFRHACDACVYIERILRPVASHSDAREFGWTQYSGINRKKNSEILSVALAVMLMIWMTDVD